METNTSVVPACHMHLPSPLSPQFYLPYHSQHSKEPHLALELVKITSLPKGGKAWLSPKDMQTQPESTDDLTDLIERVLTFQSKSKIGENW